MNTCQCKNVQSQVVLEQLLLNDVVRDVSDKEWQ